MFNPIKITHWNMRVPAALSLCRRWNLTYSLLTSLIFSFEILSPASEGRKQKQQVKRIWHRLKKPKGDKSNTSEIFLLSPRLHSSYFTAYDSEAILILLCMMNLPPSCAPICTMQLLVIQLILYSFLTFSRAQSNPCRTSCGGLPIQYPFGIDDGCGSPYYRHILVCSDSDKLELRTPSGRYPVRNLSYADPHIVVTDPFMWSCGDGENFRRTRPFSLDTSTHFKLSSQNEYVFFNCSEDNVIIEPKPIFCEHFPEHCDSSCDSTSYLCRHLPGCSFALSTSSCCSYYPKATESLRLMLKYCTSYTSIYWRNVGAPHPYDQVPEYGIRIDFDIPVTTRCLQCQDPLKGGGTCGFDTQTQSFMCLCKEGNSTTHCKDQVTARHNRKVQVIAGTVSAVTAAGAFGIGAGIWFFKKVRAKAPVTCGVQSNDNRLF